MPGLLQHDANNCCNLLKLNCPLPGDLRHADCSQRRHVFFNPSEIPTTKLYCKSVCQAAVSTRL